MPTKRSILQCRSRPPLPSMRPANGPVAGIPAPSARFRRGSRGPGVAPPETRKMGVVERAPNLNPGMGLLPPNPPGVPEPVGSDSAPASPPVGDDERRERGARGRGERGRRGGGGGAAGGGGGERGQPQAGGRAGGGGEGGGGGPGRAGGR